MEQQVCREQQSPLFQMHPAKQYSCVSYVGFACCGGGDCIEAHTMMGGGRRVLQGGERGVVLTT